MKNLMLLMLLTFSISIVGNSQVKDKFRDRDNSSTIVVIKEDQAIDTELLDQHFDLSQMSMNDQIMITTKPEQPSIPEATPSPEPTPIPEAPAFEESTASLDDVEVFFEELETEEKEIASSEEKAERAKSSAIAKSKVNSAPKRAKSNYPSKSGYEVKKAAQKKYYAKSKIKKRKRNNKRRKRFRNKKSGSCYSF
jgi:hypothetical protein